MGATVRSAISRSVIDLNRDPSGVSLYLGQNTTGLCPLTTFDNQPLYHAGANRMKRKSPVAATRISCLTTMRWRRRSRACAHATAPWWCTTRTRSARISCTCSRANCRSSTWDCRSVRRTGHLLRQRPERRGGKPAEDQRHEPRATAASRAAGSPATTATSPAACTAPDGTCLPRLHARAAARPGRRTQLAHPLLDLDHAAHRCATPGAGAQRPP